MTFSQSLSLEDLSRKLAQSYAPQPDESESLFTPDQLRCAAVLIPVYFDQNAWHLILTRRTDVVQDHKGQVSFPGGACEPGDHDVVQTALREAEEEIGLRPNLVQIVGRLKPFETVSTYRIHPVVGVIPWPYPFNISPHEVARVFSIPLTWLADPQHRALKDYFGRSVLYFDLYDGELLWGISAAITVQLIELLNQ